MSSIPNKQYLENVARNTLIGLFHFQKEDLLIKDKPDIQSKSGKVGIEVVWDTYSNEQETMRFIETIWQKSYDSVDSKKLLRLKSLGGELKVDYTGLIVEASCGSKENKPDHLICTIEEKNRKLNSGGYCIFLENQLYVFVGSMLLEPCESYIYSVLAAMRKSQSSVDCRHHFDKLYLDQHYVIYECDIAEQKFSKIKLTQTQMNNRSKEAEDGTTDRR